MEMQDWNGTTAMERDVLGRLTGVTDHNGRKTGFTYDAAGNRTGIRYPDGSAAAYAYNASHQPVKAAYRFGETAGMEETFTYDVLGRITGSAAGRCSMCRIS